MIYQAYSFDLIWLVDTLQYDTEGETTLAQLNNLPQQLQELETMWQPQARKEEQPWARRDCWKSQPVCSVEGEDRTAIVKDLCWLLIDLVEKDRSDVIW